MDGSPILLPSPVAPADVVAPAGRAACSFPDVLPAPPQRRRVPCSSLDVPACRLDPSRHPQTPPQSCCMACLRRAASTWIYGSVLPAPQRPPALPVEELGAPAMRPGGAAVILGRTREEDEAGGAAARLSPHAVPSYPTPPDLQQQRRLWGARAVVAAAGVGATATVPVRQGAGGAAGEKCGEEEEEGEGG